jgi:hypothetical protein
MQETVVLPCSCDHEYQDKRYGKGRRAMNETKPASKSTSKTFRCTVCGKERSK